MFFPGSRYLRTGSTYTAVRVNGTSVLVARLPSSQLRIPLAGYHRRLVGQRLDHMAGHYLADPTAFWRICNANDSVVPDALASADLIGIPKSGA